MGSQAQGFSCRLLLLTDPFKMPGSLSPLLRICSVEKFMPRVGSGEWGVSPAFFSAQMQGALSPWLELFIPSTPA